MRLTLGSRTDIPDVQPGDWLDICHISERQAVAGLIFKAIKPHFMPGVMSSPLYNFSGAVMYVMKEALGLEEHALCLGISCRGAV